MGDVVPVALSYHEVLENAAHALLEVANVLQQMEQQGVVVEQQAVEDAVGDEDGGRRRRRRPRRQKRWWVRQWLTRRVDYGIYTNLMRELELEDPAAFKNYLRMEPAMFQELLLRISPRITKQDTFWRKPLDPALKLAITLRFLATGDSYKSLMYNFRVASNTICNFIKPVCEAIIDEYMEELISCPLTPEDWLKVANGFETRWNLPHCVGAIDGKHVAVTCPPGGGSAYFNYKHFHSIVMLAVVDSDYKFMYVDVGAEGAGSDGGVFLNTELRECLEDGSIGFPPPSPLPGSDGEPVGYFLVGDDAFPLRPWMMKPVPSRNLTREERIYNYRISRARRVVENAFGILAAR